MLTVLISASSRCCRLLLMMITSMCVCLVDDNGVDDISEMAGYGVIHTGYQEPSGRYRTVSID